MRDGEVQQIDAPTTVYESPSNLFVGSFIGNPPMNFIDASVQRSGDALSVSVGEHTLEPAVTALNSLSGGAVTLGIRAENMETLLSAEPGAFPARVEVVEPLGSQNLLTVSLAGRRLKVATHPTLAVQADQDLWIRFPAAQIRWIDPASQRVLYGEAPPA